MSKPEGMLLLAAGTAFASRNAPSRSRDAARARELPWPWVDVEMLVPVIGGGVERIVHVLPRGALGFLKQNAHVPALVGDLRSSAEMLGDGRKQLVCTPPRAHHVYDDRGQRHESRS
jgi:hypothetical protein